MPEHHAFGIYTIEDLEFLSEDALSWAAVYTSTGHPARAQIEIEAAQSFKAEIERRRAA